MLPVMLLRHLLLVVLRALGTGNLQWGSFLATSAQAGRRRGVGPSTRVCVLHGRGAAPNGAEAHATAPGLAAALGVTNPCPGVGVINLHDLVNALRLMNNFCNIIAQGGLTPDDLNQSGKWPSGEKFLHLQTQS